MSFIFQTFHHFHGFSLVLFPISCRVIFQKKKKNPQEGPKTKPKMSVLKGYMMILLYASGLQTHFVWLVLKAE